MRQQYKTMTLAQNSLEHFISIYMNVFLYCSKINTHCLWWWLLLLFLSLLYKIFRYYYLYYLILFRLIQAFLIAYTMQMNSCYFCYISYQYDNDNVLSKMHLNAIHDFRVNEILDHGFYLFFSFLLQKEQLYIYYLYTMRNCILLLLSWNNIHNHEEF